MIRLALFFIVVTSSAFAQSQPEMNAEAALNLEKSDALLNKIYSQLLKQGDDEFDKRLKVTQRTWLQYVEHHMQCLYPFGKNENPRELYGSIFPMEYAYAKAELFDERIKLLKHMLE